MFYKGPGLNFAVIVVPRVIFWPGPSHMASEVVPGEIIDVQKPKLMSKLANTFTQISRNMNSYVGHVEQSYKPALEL